MTTTVLLSAQAATGDAPFEILGLHPDLPFDRALQHARTLGGECRVVTQRTRLGGLLAECNYSVCDETSQTGCAKGDEAAAAPEATAIAAQPVSRITLEAASESAQLRRIMFAYNGKTALIAESFIATFGPAAVDNMSGEVKSWSHSRRMSWEKGAYRMGLLYRPDVVTLTVDPALRRQVETKEADPSAESVQ